MQLAEYRSVNGLFSFSQSMIIFISLTKSFSILHRYFKNGISSILKNYIVLGIKLKNPFLRLVLQKSSLVHKKEKE